MVVSFTFGRRSPGWIVMAGVLFGVAGAGR
jgi:hypothetical protein